MKIMEYKCKCGSDELFPKRKGNRVGLYCCRCDKWLKWLNKDEINLLLLRTNIY